MEKISNIGRALSRNEAKEIVAGRAGMTCATHADCPSGVMCINGLCGGSSGNCWLRCDQHDPNDKGVAVADCERATVEAICSDLSRAVCGC